MTAGTRSAGAWPRRPGCRRAPTLAADTIAGTAAGLAATWLAVVVRKLATGQVPGPLMISAAMLCLQAALVFAAGQAWIYLLQFPLAKLVLSLLFARSAPAGQPLIARLAAEMTSLRQNCQENSGLHRYFRVSPGCGRAFPGRWRSSSRCW
jgi:hypothetical protein